MHLLHSVENFIVIFHTLCTFQKSVGVFLLTFRNCFSHYFRELFLPMSTVLWLLILGSLWPQSFLFFSHLHPFLFLLKKEGICHGQISLINLSFSTSIIINSALLFSFYFLLLCYLINTLPFQYHESLGNPNASTVSFTSSAYTQIFTSTREDFSKTKPSKIPGKQLLKKCYQF